MPAIICRSKKELDETLGNLKLSACPHCKAIGTLNRHGLLCGYEEGNVRHKTVRAHRVFCSNRNRANGCGRAFSIWMADKVKRLFLSADSLWQFLKNAANTDNKSQAFTPLDGSMSESAPYRIWKRFQKAQGSIRTALLSICPPPRKTADQGSQNASSEPAGHTIAQQTIAHLVAAFGRNELNPIAAFQVTLQTFFI